MLQKPKIGDVIDGFELVERLATGGMASLWRASRAGDNRAWVLKIPFLDPGGDASIVVGYEVEEMILKRLVGPHVPSFAGSGDLSRLPYIAMEFVEGETLAKLAEKAPLPFAEVADLGARIATALAAVHRQKVVHLDLKPENIMLAERGAVLLDFGLAFHSELPDLLGEESTIPMGSSAYISPEQVLGIRGDPASDLFAVGVILYQLATGIEPFGRPATATGMRRRLFQTPDLPRKLVPRLPRWLEAIILRCLEVDRSRRYASAEALLFDLNHPDQVKVQLYDNASSGSGRGWLRRWLSPPDERSLVGRSRASAAGPAILVAAVDLASGIDVLAEAIRSATAQLMSFRADSRLACVTVLKTEIISQAPATDEEGRPTYIARLVALKEWARPLDLPEDRTSFHVLEAVSPADAVLRFAEHNGAGHIVIGARASSVLRRHLGSVSSQVVAEARCSVSVVRVQGAREAPASSGA